MMCRMRTLSLHNDASPSRGAAVDEAGGGAYYAQWVQCLTMHDSLVGADDIEVRRRGAGGVRKGVVGGGRVGVGHGGVRCAGCPAPACRKSCIDRLK